MVAASPEVISAARWGQRGERCRRAFEGDLALLLQSIEVTLPGVQCLGQLFTHAQLDAVANNQKNGRW